MSNTRSRALPPAAVQALAEIAPDPQALAMEDIGCAYCPATASILTHWHVSTPPTVEEGAEPTPEQAEAIAQGHKIALHLACTGCGARFRLVYWQTPGQIARRVLCDADGNPVKVGQLAAARSRQAAVANLWAPGKAH